MCRITSFSALILVYNKDTYKTELVNKIKLLNNFSLQNRVIYNKQVTDQGRIIFQKTGLYYKAFFFKHPFVLDYC